MISRSLVKGWPSSNHGDAMIARTQNYSSLSRDSRSHPAPRLPGREALICCSLVKGCRISNHSDAMTAGAQKSDRLPRDPRSHPASRLAGREALISRSLVEGCRISNHGDAMTAGAQNPTGFLAILRAIPPHRVAGVGALICRFPVQGCEGNHAACWMASRCTNAKGSKRPGTRALIAMPEVSMEPCHRASYHKTWHRHSLCLVPPRLSGRNYGYAAIVWQCQPGVDPIAPFRAAAQTDSNEDHIRPSCKPGMRQGRGRGRPWACLHRTLLPQSRSRRHMRLSAVDESRSQVGVG